MESVLTALQLGYSWVKSIHGGSLEEFYNHIKRKRIIDSRLKAAGISDAIKLGSSNLLPIDPFRDIDPMLGGESESSSCHLLAPIDVTAEEFELLCGKMVGPENDYAVTDDKTDSEREEVEL